MHDSGEVLGAGIVFKGHDRFADQLGSLRAEDMDTEDFVGLRIAASGLFEVNTTGVAFNLNGVNVDEGLRVGFTGSFDFLGFATGSGVGTVAFDGSGFQTSIKGSLEIGGGLTFDVLAGIGRDRKR